MLTVTTELYVWSVDLDGKRIRLVEKLDIDLAESVRHARHAAFIDDDGIPKCYAEAEKDDDGWASCDVLERPVVGEKLRVIYTSPRKSMGGSPVATIEENS